MRVLINGLGCTVTGSRVILDEIINASPSHVELTAIVPIMPGSAPFDYPPGVRLIKLKHSIWGMYLRIFVEIWVNIMMLFRRFDLMINLSSYGLCFTSRQLLYIHNPMILDLSAEKKIGKGQANKLVRLALNTFIKSGERVYVQTKHMYSHLMNYCEASGLTIPSSAILKPPFPVTGNFEEHGSKKFGFQFFYPISPFPHKRGDLAIDAVQLIHAEDRDTGLVITLNGESTEVIEYTGPLSLQQAHAVLRSSDALLFTSEKETLGLPLLEAMNYGKPAVLPRREYATEIYGDAASYYDGNSPADIAEAIRDLRTHYQEYSQKTLLRKEEELKSRITWTRHWDEFLGVVK